MEKLRKILMDDALAEKFYDSKLGGGGVINHYLNGYKTYFLPLLQINMLILHIRRIVQKLKNY